MTEATNEAPAAPEPSTLLTDPPTAEGQAAAGQGEQGAEPAAKPEEKPAEAPEGAPEAYEFTPPEGHVLDDGVIGKFSEVAKELNLSQASAQKVIDAMTPAMAAAQVESYKEFFNDIGGLPETWASAAKADKEYGGDRLDENLAVANKAYEQFATPQLKGLLGKTQFGDHPEVIRMFYRIGKAISPDSVISGKAAPSPADRLSALYDNTPKS